MAKRDSSTRKVFKPSVWADRSGVGYFIIFKMFLSMCYEYLKMASIKVKQILTYRHFQDDSLHCLPPFWGCFPSFPTVIFQGDLLHFLPSFPGWPASCPTIISRVTRFMSYRHFQGDPLHFLPSFQGWPASRPTVISRVTRFMSISSMIKTKDSFQ